MTYRLRAAHPAWRIWPLAGLSVVLFVSGCERPKTAAAPVAPSAASSAPAPAPANDVNTQRRAVAELFENLTEKAFSEPAPKLDQMVGEAKAAALKARAALTPEASQETDRQLAALESARQSGDRPSLAIASVELYRVFVSSVTGPQKVPTAVNLLDYAGFRYDADLKAKPVRWSDAAAAAAFAEAQWKSIASQVKDPALKSRVDRVVSDLASAANSRSTALANRAAHLELDLVDELESYFTAHG